MGRGAQIWTMPRYDASTAECLLFTEKAGLMSAVAHDLKLLVTRFEVSVEGGAVRATFDASSVRVVCARREGRDAPGVLSAKDRAEIEQNIARDVLQTAKYPEIAFRSTAIAPHEGGFRVDGVLSLHGRERPIAMLARRHREEPAAGAAGRPQHPADLALVDGRLHQPDFGIVPYSAMLGALRIKPEVAFRLVLPWQADLAPAG